MLDDNGAIVTSRFVIFGQKYKVLRESLLGIQF